MEDKEKLKELALELREIWEDNRLSRRSSKFETYFKYILNEDIKIGHRRNVLKKLTQYQYYMGRCREGDAFSEETNHSQGNQGKSERNGTGGSESHNPDAFSELNEVKKDGL